MTLDEKAVVLSDDRDVERLPLFEPEKAILLTTWDYLGQLEEARRVRSAGAAMEAVRKAGRNPPRRDLWSDRQLRRLRRVERLLRRNVRKLERRS